MQELLDAMKSKKLWVLIIGITSIMVGHYLGLDDALLSIIGAAIASYQVGQGIADHGKEKSRIEHKNGY